MNSKFQIIPARKEKIGQIVSVANSYQINKLTAKEIKNSGFLVSEYTDKDYLSYLKYAEHFYLCMNKNELAGFILAYTHKNIKKTEWLNNKIKDKESNAFVLIKQICVAKEYQGKGIAQKLYKHLFKQMELSVCYAVIVTEPLNIRSIKFHEKLAFEKQFEALPPDGLKRGVWKFIKTAPFAKHPSG